MKMFFKTTVISQIIYKSSKKLNNYQAVLLFRFNCTVSLKLIEKKQIWN